MSDHIFLGMDVHVRNSYLCLTDAAGQPLKRGRIGNTLGELAAFLGPFAEGGDPVRVEAGLESTTNSRAICRMLQEYGRRAGVEVTPRVLHARKLRVIAESFSKCDRRDAVVISELLASNMKLPECYVPDQDVFVLREQLRGRYDLVRVRTMLKNRVHALLHRRGVPVPAGGLFTRAGRAYLEQLELDAAGRELLGQFLGLIDELDRTIATSDRSLRTLAQEERWRDPLALLMTMPGIGRITGLTILAELGDLSRFGSRAAVSNFAGLVPRVRGSNDTQHYGHITRCGPRHLRWVLAEAAWVAIRFVPAYRAIFDRVAARRGKAVAIVAVARRMLEDAWTMLIRHEQFRFAAPSPMATTTATTTANRRTMSTRTANKPAAPSTARMTTATIATAERAG